MRLYLLLPTFLLISCLSASGYSQGTYFIKCGVFYNSEQAIFQEDMVIKVSGEKIVGLLHPVDITPNDSLIDWSDYTVLPGLIDCHTHFLSAEYFDSKTGKLEPDTGLLLHPAQRIQMGEDNLRSYLHVGFTTIRDLGNSGKHLAATFQKPNTEGNISRPRIFNSGRGIAYRRGQFAKEYAFLDSQEYWVIQDSSEALQAVNALIRESVNLIKVYPDNAPNRDFMPPDLLSYIVTLAHKNALRVTAHAIYKKSVRLAIDAGVDCIEHIYDFDEDLLERIHEKGIWVVPTYEDKYSGKIILRHLPGFKKRLLMRLLMPATLRDNRRKIQSLYAHHLKICSGSDAYLTDETDYIDRGAFALSSLFSILESGIPTSQALQANTYHAGILLGQRDRLGVLKTGAYADIIAIKGDLRKSTRILRSSKHVIIGGKLVP